MVSGRGSVTTTVTLDTNVLQEYWKQQARVAIVEELLDLAEDELINLMVTRRIYEDVPHPPLADRIGKLNEIRVNLTGTVFRLNVSALNSGDVLGSDMAIRVFDSVSQNLTHQGQSPPDWRDWDHLHGHYLSMHDVFLTWDKNILRAAPQLKARLDIVVMKPEEFIAKLSAQRIQ